MPMIGGMVSLTLFKLIVIPYLSAVKAWNLPVKALAQSRLMATAE